MSTFVTVIHVITCVLIVLVVLMQSGKGAEISASLGGSSQTIFGSSGGVSFFTKFTFALAGIFMMTSITLTILESKRNRSVFEGVPVQELTAPAAETPVAPKAPSTESTTQPKTK